MAKTKISEFSANPANNTDIDSINIAENCAPSGINDAIRELMAQLKDFQAGTAGDSFNGPIGTTTAAAGAFTTLSASGAVTLSGGTANGVAYLNGSKVLTTGSALTFDGTDLATTGGVRLNNSQYYYGKNAAGSAVRLMGINSGNVNYIGAIDSGPTDAIYGAASTFTNQAWYVGGSEQMRLTSTGLGIGTSSPGAKLDVTTAQNGATRVRVNNQNSGGSAVSGLLLDAYGGSWTIDVPASTTFVNPLQFIFGGSEKMRLDSSGNLGLGVTPSAWATYKSIDLPAGGYVSSGGDWMELMMNTYYNGGYKYKFNGYASHYLQQSGAHYWYTAPSGTAGNAISFSQVMTLDASGRLLLGTTSIAGYQNAGCFVYDTSNGAAYASHPNGAASGNVYWGFGYNGSGIGSITQNGTTGVLYNLTSDYRLKNNPEALTGSGEFIDALQPKKWQWWDGSGEGVGFIAHEFMEVAKYSGNGEKDAVDADGNPVYQSIQPSSSEVMANLVAEIQSLRARVAALESN